MNLLKSAFNFVKYHLYWPIRYGSWCYGYQKGRLQWGLYHVYYDGDAAALWLGNFYICVEY